MDRSYRGKDGYGEGNYSLYFKRKYSDMSQGELLSSWRDVRNSGMRMFAEYREFMQIIDELEHRGIELDGLRKVISFYYG